MLQDDSRIEALEFATPITPPAMQHAKGMWVHTDAAGDDGRKRWVIGGVFMLAGAAWLVAIAATFSGLFNITAANATVYWGRALLMLPFVVFGLLTIAAGLALPNVRVEHRFGAPGIRRQVRLFTFTLSELHVLSKQMLALRVYPSMSRQSGLALALITSAGVLLLPIHVTDEKQKTDPRLLRRYARWFVDVIDRPALPFDPTPFAGTPQKMLDSNPWPAAIRRLRWLARAVMMVGALGLVLVFIGGWQE
jgi:hypothetical protein